eukprot:TRINITY_DN4747_c0_g1_i13.p1 TRINITY_DN4747_c0_g1~~TRINITY_DN4747_c0_g1_i13.p1  ORF type:complete len:793 (-),score=80.64 TRINITY_DN4747_c0_g1_i13:188-2566(-)
MLEEAVTDKASAEYQRLTWDALKKSINGLINKANISNLQNCVLDLFSENLVRGRGVLAQSVMRAQIAAPEYTPVYAALLAIVNTKLPENGELIVRRVIISFRRSFKRNDKVACVALMKFIAHLVNQQICHEILVLQILTLLLEKPTDDSVEISIALIKECGATLSEISPQGLHAIFERLRAVLHEGEIDKRVQYMVEGLFSVRKQRFADFPALAEGLDLVDEDDQITHEIYLDDLTIKEEKTLNVFKVNPQYLEDEEKYAQIKKQILGEESEEEEEESGSGSGEDSDSESEDDDEAAAEPAGDMQIEDHSDVNVTTLRRVIYLTIMSSLSHDECAHKLMKVQIPPGFEHEVCNMMIECNAQEKTYLRFYGLLAERFCGLNPTYQEKFDEAFYSQYSTIHRLETNKLRNTAKIFSHLIHTDSISWSCLSYITLSEEDTTSSSRIFVKILFQDLCEHLGLKKLNDRMHDPSMAPHFTGLFPRDNPRNTRFAINFFTSVGLGGLTEQLREHLKNAPKMIMQQKQDVDSDSSSSDSSSSDSSSSSSSSSDSSSSSSSSSSDSSSDDDDGDKDKKPEKGSRSKKESKQEEKPKDSEFNIADAPDTSNFIHPSRRQQVERPKVERSPPRRDRNSPPRRDRNSPPRRDRNSPPRRRNASRSPPRRDRNSPPKRRNASRSPPRRGRDNRSPPRRGRNSSRSPARRHDSRSPPRRGRDSPPRTRESRSPPKRGRHEKSPAKRRDSPPRRGRSRGSRSHSRSKGSGSDSSSSSSRSQSDSPPRRKRERRDTGDDADKRQKLG